MFLDGVFYIYLLCPSDPSVIQRPFHIDFCLDDLLIDVNGVLKSPTVIAYYCLVPLCFLLNVLCIWVLPFWVHKYLQVPYLLVGLFPLLLYSVPHLLLVSFLQSLFV